MSRNEWQSTFIALWQQGLTCPTIAQRLDIPAGTARSRAYALQRRGKIQPRPQGSGRVPARRATAQVSADTAQAPRDTPRVSTDTPLPSERGQSVRWTLHLSERVGGRIKAHAKARGLQDSQMVEGLLWLALSLVEEPTTAATAEPSPERGRLWSDPAVLASISVKLLAGTRYQDIAAQFNAEGVQTDRWKHWTPSMVYENWQRYKDRIPCYRCQQVAWDTVGHANRKKVICLVCMIN